MSLLLFTICGVGARALGMAQPVNPLLEGFSVGCEGMDQPCWYGIVPGKTGTAEALSKLQQMGFEANPDGFGYRFSATGCSMILLSDVGAVGVDYYTVQGVSLFGLYECSTLRIGDVAPVNVKGLNLSPYTGLYLIVEASEAIVSLSQTLSVTAIYGRRNRLSLQSRIDQIVIHE